MPSVGQSSQHAHLVNGQPYFCSCAHIMLKIKLFDMPISNYYLNNSSAHAISVIEDGLMILKYLKILFYVPHMKQTATIKLFKGEFMCLRL